jgi:dipeptidyl aminopeptidase/acylaminoacyl peptidase
MLILSWSRVGGEHCAMPPALYISPDGVLLEGALISNIWQITQRSRRSSDLFRLQGASRHFLHSKYVPSVRDCQFWSFLLRIAQIGAILFIPSCLSAVVQPNLVTVDDIAAITHIQSWSVSPDGSYVAFLTVQVVPRQNTYLLTLLLRATADSAQPTLLARYVLPPEDVYYRDIPSLRKTASQYLWSPDSRWLLYTVHNDAGMALEVLNVAANDHKALLEHYERVEINGVAGHSDAWKIVTFKSYREGNKDSHFPADPALRMKDGYMLYSPPSTPSTVTPARVESWEYVWGTKAVRQVAGSSRVECNRYPAEMLQNGDVIDSDCPADTLRDQRQTTVESAPASLVVEVGPEGTALRITRGGDSREFYEDNAELRETNNAEDADITRDTYMSADGRVAVLWRSTNLMPDELVKLNLITGKLAVLFSPNESFRRKTREVRVRFIPINIGGGRCYGRLYLPGDRGEGKRYPLVFTTYIASPGFDIGSGGEVPILALVSHGVAVFSLEVHPIQGRNGDFATTHERWEVPLGALQWVVRQLTLENIIDPERVGITGLSFGAEIAMYAYWTMETLRAVSAASDIGWTPSMYFMAGPAGSLRNDDLGFPEPNDGAYKVWKTFDAGLNARDSLPPLLWQTADSERNAQIETWTRLRRSGAQVEWLEYPSEGHVKRGPANKWWVNQRNLDWFLFWLKDEEDTDPIKADEYSRWREMRKSWGLAQAARELKRERP